MNEIKGKVACIGIAIGPLYQVKKADEQILREEVTDAEAELARFSKAREQAVLDLEKLQVDTAAAIGEENSLLFEIHRMMLEDSDYGESIEEKIMGENLSAPYSVQETAKEFAAMFTEMDDEYMKARGVDVIDVSNRVIDILLGRKEQGVTLDTPSVLFADDFTPSETAQLDRAKVLALLTAKGSVNSHTAIFARTMGIPAIIGLEDALGSYPDGTLVGVDGEMGIAYAQPSEDVLALLREKQEKQSSERHLNESLIGKATQTRSGRKVKLFANIGSVADVDIVLANDAEGIGLLRSEFIYLESNDYPTEQRLFDTYKAIAEKMGDRQVVIRTLDIGADKQASYFNLDIEENPALGMRAIRICLTQPEIFKTQLRAILRASAFGNVAIMFPMIISAQEVRQAKQILEEVKQELSDEKIPYDTAISVGIMIETPASAVISDMLADEVDFFSVGTNDLTQYTLAIDRQNESLSQFNDSHHPAVLRLIEMSAKSAKKAGIWIGICGELAADTALIQKFLEMGIDELSVAPPLVLPTRRYIRELE